jgi:hypothetical protein
MIEASGMKPVAAVNLACLFLCDDEMEYNDLARHSGFREHLFSQMLDGTIVN